MKFVTAKYNREEIIGVVDEKSGTVIPLNVLSERRFSENIFPASLIDCITLNETFINDVQSLLQWAQQNDLEKEIAISLTDLKLLAPIPRPNKNIFCVGKNYADHAIEMGSSADIPEHLIVFTKAPTTVIGPGENIARHANLTDELDYEGELAVIIGKECRNISKTDAFNYVFGYTILNDITARDLQSKHKQFFIGKSLDKSCPIGPWIVHQSSVKNPHSLHIETKVNGEVRQSAATDQFIFPIDTIIEQLSKGMTLEPGDVIATGTPAGVGKGFNPPKFLQIGDEVEITIENIGTLKNKISIN